MVDGKNTLAAEQHNIRKRWLDRRTRTARPADGNHRSDQGCSSAWARRGPSSFHHYIDRKPTREQCLEQGL